MTLSVAECAALTGTSRSWMYAALERGEVPGLTRIGGRILVNTRAFLTYFEEDQ